MDDRPDGRAEQLSSETSVAGPSQDDSPVVLFDVTTLASVRRSPATGRLDSLTTLPDVDTVLEHLLSHGVRVGVVAIEDQAQLSMLLRSSPLDRLVEPGLVFGSSHSLDDVMARVGGEAGANNLAPCVLVADDRSARGAALGAGLRVSPHPRLSWSVLEDGRLRYVRLTVPASHVDENWRPAVLALAFVPLHASGDRGRTVYGVTTNEAAAQLDDLGFFVDRLGAQDDPLLTDVYLLRDDRQVSSGFLEPDGSSSSRFAGEDDARSVLASASEGLYVAVPAGRSIESYHFDRALHGHTERLTPDLSLLRPPARAAPASVALDDEEARLDDDEVRLLAQLGAESIARDLSRYVGTAPVASAGELTVESRHVFHRHNSVAIDGLVRDLQSVGDGRLEVRLHPFVHEGRVLQNVEATLPGEHDELVLVTAHVDSTGASLPGYEAPRDPAPGADDDGSGMVAVLNVARTLCALTAVRAPRRTLRFVLFNAEEHGLVGSKAYAREQAALGAPIVAVLQMDMIGYNRRPPRAFEVHAGCRAVPEAEERSLALARRIAAVAPQVSPELEPPQIYGGRGPHQPDPADGRSDHASFQLIGHAACVVSEDFFAGPEADSPGAEPNPNYHLPSDTFVDPQYAADLARVVAGAAWITATT